ncbi:Arylsulfotransferase (ASST) [Haloplanus vescus]|uniref:Arylsulfotransferase (ASST) n=1 Tax=Haloplanus vescus TaxID=555874 RepID=A0A1H3X544_9EURY|nr:arylsulfotransferase family protein [Haloplanus vescus]SDZ94370.1 Arylsulfotransferase (ASST) [Haloplanus vescus]
MSSRLGTGDALVVLGCLCFLTTAVAGAALSPTAPAGATASDEARTTLVGVQGVGSYHDGGSVRLLDGGEEQWRTSTDGVYFDVTRLDNGSVLAGFMADGYQNCGPYSSPCFRTGFRIIDPDPSPEVTYEWSFPVRNRVASEVHDVEPLPDGGFVVADMEHERIVVVEDGEVTWQWNASTRYDPPADPTTTDWLHINDVDRIGDGRFLVSVRNANQLLVLQRGEGVVEVINADHDDASDDDGLVGDPNVLYHQHNPQWLGDGAVLVADSENHRVVELHRTDDGSWEPVWVLRGAAGQRFDWPRDADRLPNGNTLITDTRNARLVEINASGTVVWEHQFDYRTLPYEADRLPTGEPVGAPTYGDAGTMTAAGSQIPVLTPLLRLLSAAVRLPLWVGEIHLFLTLVSIAFVGSGLVVRWRE